MASNFLFLYFVLSWKNSSVIGHFSVDSHLKRSLFNSQTWLTVCFGSVQFSCSVVFGSAISWSTALQASLSITNSQRLLKHMSIKLVMPSNHLILCCPLLLLPSIFPHIRVFSNESVLRIRWPKCWSFSFSIGPSNEHSELISFRMDWFSFC